MWVPASEWAADVNDVAALLMRLPAPRGIKPQKHTAFVEATTRVARALILTPEDPVAHAAFAALPKLGLATFRGKQGLVDVRKHLVLL